MTTKDLREIAFSIRELTKLDFDIKVNDLDDTVQVTFGEKYSYFNRTFSNALSGLDQMLAYAMGVIAGYKICGDIVVNQQRENAANAARIADRKHRTAKFNPWDFCGVDKIRPVLMGVYCNAGEICATDSHVLLVVKQFDYPESAEGKIVDIDFNSLGEFRFPNYRSVIPAVGARVKHGGLVHDWAWIAQWAKQAKKDEREAKRDNSQLLNVCGVCINHDAGKKLAAWLKAFACDEMGVYTNGNGDMLILETPKSLILIMGVLANDEIVQKGLITIVK